MSSKDYNYLALDGEEDKKEPLIPSNNQKKFGNGTVDEEPRPQQSSSSDDDSSHAEHNVDIYKMQQNEAIKKLTWVCVICTFFMIIEIIGGYLANSIAIMSDAAHLLSDLLGFIISITVSLAVIPPNEQFFLPIFEGGIKK